MTLRRVVVTGMGALTPIGNNLNSYWNGLISGTSGCSNITHFDTSEFKTKFACELKGFDPADHFEKKEFRRYDRFSQYGIVAASESIKDSKIIESNPNFDRIGVIWGAGIGGLETFQNEVLNYSEGNGTPRFNPFMIPKMIPDIAPGLIAMKYGFQGPNYATVSACASSSNALIDALTYIRIGHADVIVAGGSEAPITIAGVGGFNAMHALSTRNNDPSSASRPFDRDRDGFVLGEGAGSLILEDYEHAVNRGAKIYAELIGGGLSCDAYHMTAPHPDGRGAIKVMKNCLDDANLNTSDIDLINMHGTSTPLGDVAESKAIKEVFQDDVYKLNINSTKSMTGHLLGAAGAVEAISCILAMKHGIIPPTINHFNDDENIDSKLNFTFSSPQKRSVDIAMSNTFGFGGHNACVIFKKLDQHKILCSIKKVLKLDSDIQEKFKIIAIHSNLKIYSLAFQINKYCITNFIRSNNDLKFENKSKILHYTWNNKQKGIDFELFENKFNVEIVGSELIESLFSFANTKELSLIESHKEVDFFIKQNCYFSTSNLIERISKIPNVSLVYKLPSKELSENFNLDI